MAAMGGNVLFTSGISAAAVSGQLVADPEGQVGQTLRNLTTTLRGAGLEVNNVVKMRVRLAGELDYSCFASIFSTWCREHFAPDWYPVTTIVVTNQLAEPDSVIEVDAIASGSKRPHPAGDGTALASASYEPMLSGPVGASSLLFLTVEPSLDERSGIEVQIEETFAKLERYLLAAGYSREDIVKINYYMRDLSEYPAMLKVRNPIVRDWFPRGTYPVSTPVLGSSPTAGVRLQIEAVAAQGKKEAVFTDRVSIGMPSRTDLPSQPLYSLAIRAADWLFVAGQGPLDRSGVLVGNGDAQEQATQVLENLDVVIDAAGAKWADLVHLTTWLRRQDVHADEAVVRNRFLETRLLDNYRPAITSVIAPTPLDSLIVETEAIAYGANG